MTNYSPYSNIASDTTSDARFKITVDTNKAGSANDTFVLPTAGAGIYDYWVDWGDGGAEEHIVVNTSQTKAYAASGTYQIKIRGTFPRIVFNDTGDKLKLISIDNWGDIVWSSMAYAFWGCANMEENYTDTPNTGNVSRFEYMFSNCAKFNGDVNFDTHEGTVFLAILAYCPIFNKPVNFDTSKGSHFGGMFVSCDKFNQNISSLDVHLATVIGNILKNCYDYSTANYDALLISWGAQVVQDGVTLEVYATYTPGGAAEAARDHLETTHGWTILDRGACFDSGKLILNLDDGGNSQYVAYEDLVTQGEKATFYIISSVIGGGSALSWVQLQTMYAAGMDIQCHTYSHPYLTSLTEAQVKAQYDDLDTQFVANSLPATGHTAYPYGAQNANVQTWTATRRLTARGVGVGYVIPSSDKMALSTYSMDDATDYVALKAAMLVGLQNKHAIMIYGHGIGPEQIPRDRFNEVIDYAQSIGMDIITISELYALM
jgi:hypothetical protein